MSLKKTEDTSKSKYHAMAGGMTGLIEYSFMYPIDFIKTRMQALDPHPKAIYGNVRSCIITIIKEEGMHKFFRGIPVPFIASIPAHSLYYMTYEKLKRKLSGTEGGYNNPFAQGAAGAAAVITHNVVMNPADVIKQRMQVYGSPYKSSAQCFQQVFYKEGFRAFYRSLTTQIAIDVPYASLHFVVYEFCQNLTNPDRIFNATSHILSGAIAGGIAAAATTPLDVCRTLINTQECAVLRKSGNVTIKGLSSAIRTVHQMYGMHGFFRGVSPRILHHVPSMAVCWIVYEFFKRYFFEKDIYRPKD